MTSIQFLLALNKGIFHLVLATMEVQAVVYYKEESQPPPLTLNGSVLNRVSSYNKYLGVTITSDLSWSFMLLIVVTKPEHCLDFYVDTFINTGTLLLF